MLGLDQAFCFGVLVFRNINIDAIEQQRFTYAYTVEYFCYKKISDLSSQIKSSQKRQLDNLGQFSSHETKSEYENISAKEFYLAELDIFRELLFSQQFIFADKVAETIFTRLDLTSDLATKQAKRLLIDIENREIKNIENYQQKIIFSALWSARAELLMGKYLQIFKKSAAKVNILAAFYANNKDLTLINIIIANCPIDIFYKVEKFSSLTKQVYCTPLHACLLTKKVFARENLLSILALLAAGASTGVSYYETSSYRYNKLTFAVQWQKLLQYGDWHVNANHQLISDINRMMSKNRYLNN